MDDALNDEIIWHRSLFHPISEISGDRFFIKRSFQGVQLPNRSHRIKNERFKI